MLDALLFAVRDAIRGDGFGYSEATCEVMPDGHPPPRCGDIFLAIHEGPTRSRADNCLDEYFDFFLTLTLRTAGVPIDRVGDQLLARNLARRVLPGQPKSFNARAEEMRAFMHMNWGVLQDANNNLVAFLPDAQTVYGFVEPARYRGMEVPVLQGGDWFASMPEASDVGLKSQLRFEDCRRLQAIATYT